MTILLAEMVALFSDLKNNLQGLRNAAAVDLSTTDAVLTTPSRRLFIGNGGVLKVDMAGGQTVTFVGVPAGYSDLSVTRVYKGATSCTNIVALW
jgi:hypothetical protein